MMWYTDIGFQGLFFQLTYNINFYIGNLSFLYYRNWIQKHINQVQEPDLCHFHSYSPFVVITKNTFFVTLFMFNINWNCIYYSTAFLYSNYMNYVNNYLSQVEMTFFHFSINWDQSKSFTSQARNVLWWTKVKWNEIAQKNVNIFHYV